jgi:hypothetical protein
MNHYSLPRPPSYFPPTPPTSSNDAYTKITYYNSNNIKRNDNGKNVNDNTCLYYYNGKEYVKLGTTFDIMKKGHADKFVSNGETHDMRNYQNDLYVKSGGYRKNKKSFRIKSKRIKKRKTIKRKTIKRKTIKRK